EESVGIQRRFINIAFGPGDGPRESKAGDEEKPKDEVDETNFDRLNGDVSKGIPGSRLSAAKFVGPSMKFLFCTS
ncbi:unnamed protein product, partial [Allacma fusca]